MLRQGPLDKNDVKLNHLKPYNLQCHLRQHAATSISTQWISTNSWSNYQREVFRGSQGEFHLNKNVTYTRYLHTCTCTSAAFNVAETFPMPHFHLASIPVLFWGDPQAQHLNTCPTALKSHKSRTPLVHHVIPCFSTIQKPFLLWIFPPVVNNCAKSSPTKQLYFLDVLSLLIE